MKKAKVGAESLNRYNRLQAKVDAARAELAQFKKDLALEAPVKPGDITEVTGISFQGKRMLVDKVFVKDQYRSAPRFVASGKVLKGDGTPGKQTAQSTWEIEKC